MQLRSGKRERRSRGGEVARSPSPPKTRGKPPVEKRNAGSSPKKRQEESPKPKSKRKISALCSSSSGLANVENGVNWNAQLKVLRKQARKRVTEPAFSLFAWNGDAVKSSQEGTEVDPPGNSGRKRRRCALPGSKPPASVKSERSATTVARKMSNQQLEDECQTVLQNKNVLAESLERIVNAWQLLGYTGPTVIHPRCFLDESAKLLSEQQSNPLDSIPWNAQSASTAAVYANIWELRAKYVNPSIWVRFTPHPKKRIPGRQSLGMAAKFMQQLPEKKLKPERHYALPFSSNLWSEVLGFLEAKALVQLAMACRFFHWPMSYTKWMSLTEFESRARVLNLVSRATTLKVGETWKKVLVKAPTRAQQLAQKAARASNATQQLSKLITNETTNIFVVESVLSKLVQREDWTGGSEAGIISVAVHILKIHYWHTRVQEMVLMLLGQMARRNREDNRMIRKHGGATATLEILRAAISHPLVAKNALRLLASLAERSKAACLEILQHEGEKMALKALKMHGLYDDDDDQCFWKCNDHHEENDEAARLGSENRSKGKDVAQTAPLSEGNDVKMEAIDQSQASSSTMTISHPSQSARSVPQHTTKVVVPFKGADRQELTQHSVSVRWNALRLLVALEMTKKEKCVSTDHLNEEDVEPMDRAREDLFAGNGEEVEVISRAIEQSVAITVSSCPKCGRVVNAHFRNDFSSNSGRQNSHGGGTLDPKAVAKELESRECHCHVCVCNLPNFEEKYASCILCDAVTPSIVQRSGLMVLDDLQILSNRPVWLSDWNGTADSLPRGPSRALLIALKMLKESTDEGVQSWGLNLLANFAVHSQACCQFITDLGAGEAAARGIQLALDRPKFCNAVSAHSFQRQIKKMSPSLYCHSHLQRECSAAHAAMRGISLFVLQVHYGVAQPWILKFMKGIGMGMTVTGIDLTLNLLERHKKFAILQDRGLSLLSKIASKHPSLLFGGDGTERGSHEKIYETSSQSVVRRNILLCYSEGMALKEAATQQIAAPSGLTRPNIPAISWEKQEQGNIEQKKGKVFACQSQAQSLSSIRLRRIVDTAMKALYLHVDDARVQRLGICLLHELVRCGGDRGRSLVIDAGADIFCRTQLATVSSRLSEKTSREWFRHTAGMLYLLDNSPWEDGFETVNREINMESVVSDPEEHASGCSTRSQMQTRNRPNNQKKEVVQEITMDMPNSSMLPFQTGREVVIFWMYRMKKSCPQSRETLFAAIRLFDIALSNIEEIQKASWNLYGSACLLLASYCFENEPSLDYRILRNSFTHFNVFISETSIWDTARNIFEIHKCAVPKPTHWDCVKHLILTHLNQSQEDFRAKLMLCVAEHFLVVALMDFSLLQFIPTVVATTVARFAEAFLTGTMASSHRDPARAKEVQECSRKFEVVLLNIATSTQQKRLMVWEDMCGSLLELSGDFEHTESFEKFVESLSLPVPGKSPMPARKFVKDVWDQLGAPFTTTGTPQLLTTE